MSIIFNTIKLSVFIGVFAYVIDLNMYYVYSEVKSQKKDLLYILGGLNIISLFFLIKHIQVGLKIQWASILISFAIVIYTGIYIKNNTHGDPIFEWVRFELESRKYALIVCSAFSFLILLYIPFLNKAVQYIFGSKKSIEEDFNDNILDVDLKK